MPVPPGASTALKTDHYELTMVDAALRGGIADRPAVFELFARRLPAGRRYGVVAGVGRLLEALATFRFGDDELAWLRERGFLHERTLEWLADHRFSGDIDGYREGELYFPYSPVLTVTGTFAECVLLETLALSIYNHDSAVASAAARMDHAAGDRSLLEFGSRRTHEGSAVAAARAAYVAGFDATSNLEAGRRHGIPTAGTVAHAFVMIHDDEDDAFRAQVAAAGSDTTALVDTYDITTGIARAVEAAGPGLGAIRIDSGDLRVEAEKARRQLDELGATGTEIVVSGDLEEHAIAALADTPVDAYGVGTQLVTGSGHPTASMVYKLVARGDRPGDEPTIAERKTSSSKSTVGHRKRAHRDLDLAGRAVGEDLWCWDDEPSGGRPLQVPLVRDGEVVDTATLDDARAHHQLVRAELPEAALALSPGDPAIPTHRRGGLA